MTNDLKKKKIFMFSSVHPWNDIRIFHKEAVSLARKYDIELHIPANFSYKEEKGVKIHGLPQWKNRLTRIKTILIVLFRALKSKAQIYHFHDPELMIVGILLRFFGKNVIYDVHEDYPKAMLSKEWIPIYLRYPLSYIIHLLEWLTSTIFSHFIIIAWPKIADHFSKNKTILIQNFPILQELVFEHSTPYINRPPKLIYLGSISRIRGIIENIKALKYIKNKECRLALIGLFDEVELEKECKNIDGWKNVDYLGWQDREQVRALLDNSRIGLVLFQPHPNHMNAHPNKLFEYMSAEIPVIVSNFPLWRQIVEDAQCGLLVDPLKPKEIAKAIDWLLEHPEEAEQMGKNGRKAVVENYNWENEEKKLLQLYETILQ